MYNLIKRSVPDVRSGRTNLVASRSSYVRLLFIVLSVALFAMSGYAQSITGTLTGTVTDPSGAVVPQAKVNLKNEGSGDLRRSVSNSDGFFTFAAVPAGIYEVTIEAPGFLNYQISGLNLQAAERRQPRRDDEGRLHSGNGIGFCRGRPARAGGFRRKVRDPDDKTITGLLGGWPQCAEFIKILPGFAISNTGTGEWYNFSGESIGINGNGDGGSQSALNNAYNVNGLPTNSLDITADGAHVSDPGCNCATPVNPNTDMIQEFKVLTSNFSAENQKGPAVIQSIAKVGYTGFPWHRLSLRAPLWPHLTIG